MTPTTLPLRAYLALCIILAAVATSACDYNPYPPPTAQERSSAAKTILTLPPLEDIEEQLRNAILETAALATQLDPAVQWRWSTQIAGLGCGIAYDGTGGERKTFRSYLSDTPISDTNWPRVAERARSLAEQAGLHDSQNYKPGYHGVNFVQDGGTGFDVNSNKVAVISADTGCRLPRAVKDTSSSATSPSATSAPRTTR